MISPGKTVVLTFDDAVSNHAAFAAPLLSELGFHATFFICEFPPDFAVNKRQYMTWEQIRSLDAVGFEIANHTMTHAGLSAMAPETCEKEIELLEARFRDVGLPRSRAFGYPGGPAADYAPPLLKKLGFLLSSFLLVFFLIAYYSWEEQTEKVKGKALVKNFAKYAACAILTTTVCWFLFGKVLTVVLPEFTLF